MSTYYSGISLTYEKGEKCNADISRDSVIDIYCRCRETIQYFCIVASVTLENLYTTLLTNLQPFSSCSNVAVAVQEAKEPRTCSYHMVS